MLFTEHGGGAEPYRSGSLATIGAFRLNNEPVEYLYFPDAEPTLQRSRDRLAMTQAVVDWMAFWLQGVKVHAYRKAERYMR